MNEEKTDIIFSILGEVHREAKCELDFETPFELLVAVMLSAQCTDKRVNVVTKELFKVASTPAQIAELGVLNLEKIIKPCGLYHNKAKNIFAMSLELLNSTNGEVPKNLVELNKLPGVGRKTANVVYSVGFGGDAIAVDTHVFRVARRLGLASGGSVQKVEEELMRAIPKAEWSKSHHLLIFHGRYICKAQNPQCQNCKVRELCAYFQGGNTVNE